MSGLPPLVEPGGELTSAEIARYGRQLIIDEVGMIGQRRLRRARILVIGAGGLGSPALLYLAAAGVGTLGVIDGDVVEVSNLHRQILHGDPDLGRDKVDSAVAAVRRANPYVEVVAHRGRLGRDNAVGLFGQYDLVLDGSDNFATRYLVNDAAVLAGIPYVWGSVLRFTGQVSVFWPGHGPTYRDLHPEPPPPGAVPSCAEGGVLGAVCAAVGSIMVTEAIKLITGIGHPLLGRVLIHDALEMTFRTLELRPDPAAQPITDLADHTDGCGFVEFPEDPGITAETLAEWLEQRQRGDRAFTLVDIREPGERELGVIDGAVPLPLADLLDRWAELPAEPLVLHCRSGHRSSGAVRAVRAAGRADVQHLVGGIDAWWGRASAGPHPATGPVSDDHDHLAGRHAP